jgi:hypothetical protein
VDRFDDVEYEIVESPEPPRRRRWPVVAVAAVLATGALAAGASALTTSGDGGARTAKPAVFHGDGAVSVDHHGAKPCRRFEGRSHGRGSDSASDVRY